MEHLSLVSMKMKCLPNISTHAPDLQCLTSLNLSKNNLFNGDELFLVNFNLPVLLLAMLILLLFFFH